MVRQSYRHELGAALTFPLAASLAEGSFTAVVAAKNFDASVLLIAVITAAPMFGNVLALFWSDLAAGRRKVPFINLLQLGVIVMVASVALCAWLPQAGHATAGGDRGTAAPVAASNYVGWIFAAQIVAARLLASGIVTLRATIWRCNYPRSIRGHVTSRISTISTLVLAMATFAGSYALDINPQAYVYLYPGAALLGLIGIYQFSKIRVRQEFLLLRAEKTADQFRAAEIDEAGITDETPVLNYAPANVASRLRDFPLFRMVGQARQVLRDDPRFRLYQRWQMFSGFGFMMTAPALLTLVSTELTNRKEQYLLATSVVQLIPMAVSLVAVPLWAPLFDRVSITRFRVIQNIFTLSAFVLLAAGALSHHAFGGSKLLALGVIAVAQVFMGITNGAGALAWNLGHNEFAPPEKTSLYMGVHVMLTGVRGCLAPFLGGILYQHYLGPYTFLVTFACSAIGAAGFYSMSKQPAPQAPSVLPAKPAEPSTPTR